VNEALTIAIPKGRTLKALAPRFAKVGIDPSPLLADDRTLIREVAGGQIRFLLLKPDDVPTYVEYGAADLGICGRDILVERAYDLYQPLDLGIGICRMVVAGIAGKGMPMGVPRVATKYPKTASAHFANRGIQAEIIYVQGSVELAPLTGLSDVIVDLVETGETLVQNGLAVFEDVSRISTVVVANRASYKLHRGSILPLLDQLGSHSSKG
jgi:ATP phosphoribosyltransferase